MPKSGGQLSLLLCAMCFLVPFWHGFQAVPWWLCAIGPGGVVPFCYQSFRAVSRLWYCESVKGGSQFVLHSKLRFIYLIMKNISWLYLEIPLMPSSVYNQNVQFITCWPFRVFWCSAGASWASWGSKSMPCLPLSASPYVILVKRGKSNSAQAIKCPQWCSP